MRPPARCPCDAQAPLSLPLSRISRPRRRPAPPWSLSPPRRFPSSLTRLSLPLGIQAEQPCAVRRSSAASGMSGDLGLCLVWEAEMRERGLWREVERAKRILALQRAEQRAAAVSAAAGETPGMSPAPESSSASSTTDAAATAPTAAPPFFISERASRDPALLLFHKYRDVLSVLDPSDLLANLRLPRRHRGALRCLGCGACAALTRRQAPDNTGRNNNARAGRVSYLRGGAVSKEGHFCAHKFTAFSLSLLIGFVETTAFLPRKFPFPFLSTFICTYFFYIIVIVIAHRFIEPGLCESRFCFGIGGGHTRTHHHLYSGLLPF